MRVKLNAVDMDLILKSREVNPVLLYWYAENCNCHLSEVFFFLLMAANSNSFTSEEIQYI